MGVEGVIHFKIWEVLFRDMGGAVLRYGRCCIGGWRGGIHPEIWEVLFRDMGGAVLGGGGGHTFRDMGGAVSRYWRCCFEIWEVRKCVLGGGEILYAGLVA